MVSKLKNVYAKFLDMEKPNILDWILFLGIMIFCYFSYNHNDILWTSTHGKDLVECIFKGDFFGFYDYTQSSAVYSIIVYITFAIWSIPVFIVYKIMGLPMWGVLGYFDIPYEILMWYKLLPTIFYFAIGVLLYKIIMVIKKEKNMAKWTFYMFVASPVAMFSQFIFGQYDSIGLFFTVLALYYFIQKKYNIFSIIISIAIMYKLFALFMFIPLILLVEKRLLHIIKHLIIAMSGYVVTTLMFLNSEGYKDAMEFSGDIVPRLFSVGIETSLGVISLFTISMMVICVIAYNKKIESDDEYYSYAIYIPFFVYATMFMFVLWHPQWLMFVVPFMTLAFYLNSNTNAALILQSAMSIGYIANTAIWFQGNVDTNLLELGLINEIYPIEQYDSISTILALEGVGILGNDMYYSLFAGALAILIFMYFPTRQRIEQEQIIENKNFYIGDRGYIWLRTLTILIFVIPTIVMYLN